MIGPTSLSIVNAVKRKRQQQRPVQKTTQTTERENMKQQDKDTEVVKEEQQIEDQGTRKRGRQVKQIQQTENQQPLPFSSCSSELSSLPSPLSTASSPSRDPNVFSFSATSLPESPTIASPSTSIEQSSGMTRVKMLLSQMDNMSLGYFGKLVDDNYDEEWMSECCLTDLHGQQNQMEQQPSLRGCYPTWSHQDECEWKAWMQEVEAEISRKCLDSDGTNKAQEMLEIVGNMDILEIKQFLNLLNECWV
ncbi:2435_t:CDS:2 [Paraglomus brasilianum]|uniref:2435_t:CDS:1 n=1 Tax=Paraglomus brasilianum TaxID=144538 RepID=A0A9N8YYR4_9GLOM|nr:2435_t:CDS:2 [Paraglomus brasilianum]